MRALRELDALYFGPRAGWGSAAHALMTLILGVMPWGFVRRYMDGDFEAEVRRLR